MIHRHFGIMSSRTSPVGARGADPAATRDAILPRDSEYSYPDLPDSDHEFAAFVFGVAWAGPLVLAALLLCGYALFF